MKAWLRNIYGAIFASLLTIALNGNVYADTEDQTLPDEPPTQIIEPETTADVGDLFAPVTPAEAAPAATAPATEQPVSKPAAAPTAETGSVKTEEAVVPVTEAQLTDDLQAEDVSVSEAEIADETEQKEVPYVSSETLTDSAPVEEATPADVPADDGSAEDGLAADVEEDLAEDDDTAAAISDGEAALPDEEKENPSDEEQPVSEADAEFPVLMMAIVSDGANSEDLAAESEEEAAAAEPTRAASSSDSSLTRTENGIYIMVNHSGEEKLEAQGDITILAAGVNRVSSISGTGKVRIAGTGILLVDSLQGNLELLTLTDIYDEGSTAVFVKQAGTTSTYQLVNGTVPGILDEEYLIKGCTLIVPSGGNLLLCGTGAEPLSDGTVAYYHGTDHGYKAEDVDNVMETSGKLTIAEKAALIIKEGASVILEDLSSLGGTFTDDFTRRPLIITESDGRLTVDGTVGNGGVIELGADSVLSGGGSITAYKLTVDDPSVLEGSRVLLSMHDLFLNGAGEIANMAIHNTMVHPESSFIKLSSLVTSGNSVIVLPYGSSHYENGTHNSTDMV